MTSTVQMRLVSKTKTEMEEVCHELGMSMNTAFVIYAEKVAHEHPTLRDDGRPLLFKRESGALAPGKGSPRCWPLTKLKSPFSARHIHQNLPGA